MKLTPACMKKIWIVSLKTTEYSKITHPILETAGWKIRRSHDLKKQGSSDLNIFPSLNVQWVDHLKGA